MINRPPLASFQEKHQIIIKKLIELDSTLRNWQLHCAIDDILGELTKNSYFNKIKRYAYLLASIPSETMREAVKTYFRIGLAEFRFDPGNPEDGMRIENPIREKYDEADQLLRLILQGKSYEEALDNYKIEQGDKVDVQKQIPTRKYNL